MIWLCVNSALIATALGCGMSEFEQKTVVLAKDSRANAEVMKDRIIGISLQTRDAATLLLPRLEQLPHLTSLTITNINLNDDDFRHISKLERLTKLGLGSCNIDDAEVGWLEKLRNLNYLSLGGNPITDEGLRHLSELKSIKYLHLSNTKINGSGLSELNNAPVLEEMSLSNVDDRAIAYLEKCANLKRLYATSTKITPDGLMRLVDLHQLTRIDVDDAVRREVQKNFYAAHVASKQAARQRGEQVPPDKWSPFLPPGGGWPDAYEEETIVFAKKLQCEVGLELEHLSSISMSSRDVVTQLLPRLVKLPSVHYVKVVGVELKEEDLEKIAGLRRLTGLTLENCGLSDKQLRALAGRTRLTYLDLSGNPITDEGLKHLAPLKRLIALRLAHTNIAGPGLLALGNTAVLRTFKANDAPLDDRAMPYLERCAELSRLSIKGTKITPDGLMRLIDLHALSHIDVDDDLRRQVEKKFYEAWLASKSAARQRGEQGMSGDRNPFSSFQGRDK